MLCVEINASGQVVEDTLSTAPDCSEFMLIAPSEYDTMTYWAQLAIELEPGSEPFNTLVVAMVVAYGTVAGVKLVLRALRTEANEPG